MQFRCVPVGDQAITVQFEQVISEEVNRQVLELAEWIRTTQVNGVTELIPAYASLLLCYNPLVVTYHDLIVQLRTFTSTSTKIHKPRRRIIIPALYGGEWGPDLEEVARVHSFTVEEVIRLHSTVTYHVYMLGFSPGFPYLGGLPTELHTPRLASPRAMVPAGSIGIGGSQTGIYSMSTPGGWQIIARTPIPLFDLVRESDPFLLQAGDSLRFSPISVQEYEVILDQVNSGVYTPSIFYEAEGDGYEDRHKL